MTKEHNRHPDTYVQLVATGGDGSQIIRREKLEPMESAMLHSVLEVGPRSDPTRQSIIAGYLGRQAEKLISTGETLDVVIVNEEEKMIVPIGDVRHGGSRITLIVPVVRTIATYRPPTPE